MVGWVGESPGGLTDTLIPGEKDGRADRQRDQNSQACRQAYGQTFWEAGRQYSKFEHL